MKDSKKWWTSRCLWGVGIALGSIAAIICGDSGLFELSSDIRTQLLAANFLGLTLAGYGRIKASGKIR